MGPLREYRVPFGLCLLIVLAFVFGVLVEFR